MLTDADCQSAESLTAVEPAWSGMRTATDALGLEEHTLLHCGPPASPPHALVPPILNSAAVACVFEGWADGLDEALALVQSGSIRSNLLRTVELRLRWPQSCRPRCCSSRCWISAEEAKKHT